MLEKQAGRSLMVHFFQMISRPFSRVSLDLHEKLCSNAGSPTLLFAALLLELQRFDMKSA
jgi:hypothetical protein